MNISYFQPELPGEKGPEKTDKGLISPNQIVEGARRKAQKIEQSKNAGLMSNNEGRLLTNDGREIFNENK